MAAHPGALTLIEAAKGGDDAAFEALLEPLLQQGYRLACVLLHDQRGAEDAVQEAAFKAWRKLSQLRDGAEMRPWFLGIVANECRSSRRSRWASVVSGELAEQATEPSDDAVIEGIELRRALREMDAAKRMVLVLHWYLDLPLEEIASITGTSVHAAESRLGRATKELKRRMEARRGRP